MNHITLIPWPKENVPHTLNQFNRKLNASGYHENAPGAYYNEFQKGSRFVYFNYVEKTISFHTIIENHGWKFDGYKNYDRGSRKFKKSN